MIGHFGKIHPPWKSQMFRTSVKLISLVLLRMGVAGMVAGMVTRSRMLQIIPPFPRFSTSESFNIIHLFLTSPSGGFLEQGYPKSSSILFSDFPSKKQHHLFQIGVFPLKKTPSIFGCPHDYGTPVAHQLCSDHLCRFARPRGTDEGQGGDPRKHQLVGVPGMAQNQRCQVVSKVMVGKNMKK